RRQPLSGIKVLDFSHQAAGPWCTTLLGDMGADVVKVEKPGRGDSIRYAGKIPFEIGSLNFWGLNRNKRGIGVDLQNPAGRDLLERLALRSAVGQRVEVAMLDAVLSAFADVATNTLSAGTEYPKFGSGHPDLVPYQAFRARDGWFIVACLTNAFWKRLAPAIGRPDLLEQPKFKNMKDRVEHRTEVVATLREAGLEEARIDSLLGAHAIG